MYILARMVKLLHTTLSIPITTILNYPLIHIKHIIISENPEEMVISRYTAALYRAYHFNGPLQFRSVFELRPKMFHYNGKNTAPGHKVSKERLSLQMPRVILS